MSKKTPTAAMALALSLVNPSNPKAFIKQSLPDPPRETEIDETDFDEGPVSQYNFQNRVKPSPFLKYPNKCVSSLDIPNKNVNLHSLDVYQVECDSPVTAAYYGNDDISTGTTDKLTIGILKKGDKSRFSRHDSLTVSSKGSTDRKVTIIEEAK